MDKLDVQVARDETRRVVRDFLCAVIDPDLVHETNQVARAYIEYYHEGVHNGEITVQQAAQIDFGIGKTQAAAEVAAHWVTHTGGRLGIAVQRLELGERLIEQLRARRIDAHLFRGRNAPDPDNPGKFMCLRPDYVEAALKAHAKVQDARQ
jgi:hypothetical protein